MRNCDDLRREYEKLLAEYKRYLDMGASPQMLFMQELNMKVKSKYIEYLYCLSR